SPHPSTSTLFPYPTRFRSVRVRYPGDIASRVPVVELVDVTALGACPGQPERRRHVAPVFLVQVRVAGGRHHDLHALLHGFGGGRSEERTSELQSHLNLVCR